MFVYFLSPQSCPCFYLVSLCSVSVNTFVVLALCFLPSCSHVHLFVFRPFVSPVCKRLCVCSQSQCQRHVLVLSVCVCVSVSVLLPVFFWVSCLVMFCFASPVLLVMILLSCVLQVCPLSLITLRVYIVCISLCSSSHSPSLCVWIQFVCQFSLLLVCSQSARSFHALL